MIYLTTGANGAGKTLLTLRDVRAAQLREPHRQVFFHGFEAGDKITQEFGWKPFDPRKWQELPDGSICVMDECQNEFPVRKGSEPLPDYINAVAQFRRKRGFDFYMIAPHPMHLDNFLRRLIENPSWHRHLKRVMGAQLVRVMKFNFVNLECEKTGAGERGTIENVGYPKEVYTWYKSAELHTAKRSIPKPVLIVLACAVAAPFLVYGAFKNMSGHGKDQAKPGTTEKAAPGATAPYQARSSSQQPGMTRAEYLQAREPRLKDFPHTAPAYDQVTQPVVAPYPAACIDGIRPKDKTASCECYSQQGTRLTTAADTCKQIARNGFFIDWKQDSIDAAKPAPPVAVAAAAPGSAPSQPQQMWVVGSPRQVHIPNGDGPSLSVFGPGGASTAKP